MAKSVTESSKSSADPLKSRKSSKSRPRPNSNGSHASSESPSKSGFFYQSHYVSGLIVLIGFLVFLSYRAPNTGLNSHLMYLNEIIFCSLTLQFDVIVGFWLHQFHLFSLAH